MLKLAIFFLALAFLPVTATTQDQTPHIKSGIIGFPLPDRIPITVENADQVVELARIGSGMIAETNSSLDGRLLLYASSLGVWVYDKLPLYRSAVLLPVDTPITSVAVSDDLIAGGDEAGNIHLWDRATFELLGVLTNHLYAVRGLAFNPDGTLLATADQSGVARLWDIENLSELATVTLTGAAFDDVIFDGDTEVYLKDLSQPDALRLNMPYAYARYNVLWQIETNSIDHLLEVHHQAPESQSLGRISDFTSFAPTGVEYPVLDIVFPDLPEAVSFGVPFTDDEGLTLWFAPDESGKRQVEFFIFSALSGPYTFTSGDVRNPYYGLPPSELDRASSNEFLAVAGDSSRIMLTSAGEGETATIYLFGHTRGVPSVTFSPTDPRLLVSGSLDRTLRLWDVTAPPDTPSLTVLEGHQSGVTSVDINAAGDLIASASYDGTIRLWGIPRP